MATCKVHAAAPALLEALQEAMRCVDNAEYPEVVKQARAAIRAAKGETA
jgi:hypothetical protein